VHAIIVKSQGHIGASSEIGKGRASRSCSAREKPLPAGEPRETAAVNESAPTVVLVDDEDGVRRLMHSCLQREGYQLLQARDAEEAERVAKACPGPIHVLVTDVVMPVSGLKLADRLKPLRPEMKTLFVSGCASDEFGGAALPPREMLVEAIPAVGTGQSCRRLLHRPPALVQ